MFFQSHVAERRIIWEVANLTQVDILGKAELIMEEHLFLERKEHNQGLAELSRNNCILKKEGVVYYF